MTDNLTYVGLGEFIVKSGANDETIVFGKATGPDLDLDHQICDAAWLKSAMPAWFETGANIREQHSSIAAGVGLELSQTGDDWYVKAEVVDDSTAKKVRKGVLRGMSIGIKNARVIKDAEAPGGRIVAGDIVEVSLVDRPANPTARIEIAKALDNGNFMLVKSDDVNEVKKPSARDNETLYPAVLPCPGCNGLGKLPAETEDEKTCEICGGSGIAPEDFRADNERFGNPVDDENHNIKAGEPDPIEVIDEGDKPNDEEALPVDEAKAVEKREFSDTKREDMADKGQALPDGSYPIATVKDLKNAIQAVGRAKNRAEVVAHIKARAKALGREDLIPDTFKEVTHDAGDLRSVLSSMIALIKAELDEMLSGEENEICDVKELLCSLELFLCWWQEESEEGETEKPFAMIEEDEDEMAYVGLGVSADLVKAAKAHDATEEIKDELRAEIRKALGVDEIIADAKAAMASQEEVLKNLNAELDAIRSMATPGGPALRQTQTQAYKSAEAERLQNEAARMRQLSHEVTDPTYKARYIAKAEELEADARRILKA